MFKIVYIMSKQTVKIISLTLFAIFLGGCVPVIPGSLSTGASMIAVQHDRRTAGEIVDDNALKLNLIQLSLTDENFKQSNLSYLVFNRTLLIAGQSPSAITKSNILQNVAKQFPSVERIIDEIEIGENNSLIGRAKDIAITAQVEASLLTQEIVNPIHVRVITEKGTVYLMGDVTKREADAAVKSTSKANGVTKIIKHFNYLNAVPQVEIDRALAKEKKILEEEERKTKLQEIENKKQELLKELRALGLPEGTPF